MILSLINLGRVFNVIKEDKSEDAFMGVGTTTKKEELEVELD